MQILPSNDVPTSQTALGLGALVLAEMSALGRAVEVNALWLRLEPSGRFSGFAQWVLVLDFLFALGALSLRDGTLELAGPQPPRMERDDE